ncbi:hypothetical protein [Kribbella sp. NPDC055071]
MYIRYQSPHPDHRGRHIGIFGLVNTLSKRGLLTPAEEAFRRKNNDWYDATYTNPSDVDPSVYADNPLAAAWFKPTATHLFTPIPGYLAILHSHHTPCTRYTLPNPGQILYEDPFQVVVIPHPPEQY